jgi:branched-chain amino acid transport system permease protein
LRATNTADAAHGPEARRVGKFLLRLGLVVVGVAAIVGIVLLAPIRYVFLASELLIGILYATSLNLLMGFGGMLSLGHAAYYALGAYASGLLLTQYSWSMAPAMLVGPVVAALGALVFGIFIIRTSHQEHAYFLMLTLALSQLVFAMIYKWYNVTHGDDGITGILATGILAAPRNYCLFVLAVVAGCLFALYRIVHSPFGLTLQAIRDNPTRAQFVGLSVRRYQLLAFIIAGIFAGIAGTLYAFFSGTISPQIADWTASARPFLANTIGGVQSFWGPTIGVIVLETIDSQVGRFSEHSLLFVGVVTLLVGVYLPQGVVSLLDFKVFRMMRQLARRLLG